MDNDEYDEYENDLDVLEDLTIDVAEDQGYTGEPEEEEELDDDELKDIEVLDENEPPVVSTPSASNIIKFEFFDKAANDSERIVIRHPDDRRTSELMTQTEMTAAICYRAGQIEKNAIVYTDVTGMKDPILMAEKELNDHRCPLIVRRFISDKLCEDWLIREMMIPQSNA